MTRREFDKVVQEAIDSLPAVLRDRIVNVNFVVAESANRRQRGQTGELYGLYEGTSLADRAHDHQGLPDRITLFKRAIERDCPTRAEMVKCIQDTVIHEIGHYFGLDDDQLDELGIG